MTGPRKQDLGSGWVPGPETVSPYTHPVSTRSRSDVGILGAVAGA